MNALQAGTPSSLSGVWWEFQFGEVWVGGVREGERRTEIDRGRGREAPGGVSPASAHIPSPRGSLPGVLVGRAEKGHLPFSGPFLKQDLILCRCPSCWAGSAWPAAGLQSPRVLQGVLPEQLLPGGPLPASSPPESGLCCLFHLQPSGTSGKTRIVTFQ